MLNPWSAEVAVPIRKIRTLAMELTSQVESGPRRLSCPLMVSFEISNGMTFLNENAKARALKTSRGTASANEWKSQLP